MIFAKFAHVLIISYLLLYLSLLISVSNFSLLSTTVARPIQMKNFFFTSSPLGFKICTSRCFLIYISFSQSSLPASSSLFEVGVSFVMWNRPVSDFFFLCLFCRSCLIFFLLFRKVLFLIRLVFFYLVYYRSLYILSLLYCTLVVFGFCQIVFYCSHVI